MKHATCSLLALFFTAVVGLGCRHRLPEVRIDPAVPNPTLGEEIAVTTRSSIALPLTLRVADLERVADEKATKHFEARVNSELTHWLTHDWFSYNIDRGKITLGTNDGRITYNVPFSGRFSVGGVFGKIVHKSVQETVEVKGNVDGSTSVKFGTDWSATVDPSVQLHADKAEVKFVDLVTVSVRGRLQDAANPILPGIATKAANDAIKELHFKKMAAKAWDEAFITKQVATSPPMWLKIEPKEIRTSGVDVSGSNIVSNIGIVANTTLYVADQAPPVNRVPLPNLIIDRNPAGKFELNVPVQISIAELEKKIQEQMWGYEFDLDDVTKVKVTDIKLNTSGDRIVLKFSFDAVREEPVRLHAAGTMYALGRLQYDAATEELRIVDIDYDIETKNLLLQLADWLYKPKLLEVATSAAKVDATTFLEAGKNQANAYLADLKSPDGKFTSQVAISNIKLNDARVTHGQAFLLFHSVGKCSATVKP